MKQKNPYSKHALAFAALARQMQALESKYQAAKDEVSNLPPGNYGAFTIYPVKEYTVRSHTRGAHVRVRFNKR